MKTCAALAGLAAALTAAHAADTIIASEGDWALKKPEGSSTCILAPKVQSRIQITPDRLDVTGLPKQSIFNYQYRIDDRSVSNAMIPSPAMQEAGIVSLDGEAFRTVLDGARFQIRILDKWHEAVTEDVGLAGLRSLYPRMKDECR